MTDKLSRFGYTSFFSEQIPSQSGDEWVPARVAAEHRGQYEIWSADGEGVARISGTLRSVMETEGLPGVGDFVRLREPLTPDRIAVIEGVFNRRTAFIRGAAGRRTRPQVVAANVDVVFAVTGLDADYNPRRIERYMARIWASGADPVVVLSKSDVCGKLGERIAEVEGICFGVPVIATSTVSGEGVERIRTFVTEGITAAFVGSSGAGKSTLINALCGTERMATRETRARDGRGVHTTTHRQLIQLPGGGLLIDTPGMRELQLTDEEGLDEVFRDIEEVARGCRYRDCRHESEPGCAVKSAVEQGELASDRLESFHKLAKEAGAFELRQNEHLRRKSEKVWGQLYDEGKRIRKWKGQD